MSTVCPLCKERYNGAVFVCRVCGKPIFANRYDIIVSAAFFNLHDMSYFIIKYSNQRPDDHFFFKKNVADIDYTDFFHSDKYIDQMMEVIYYSFHNYSEILKIFITTSVYLMDRNRVCRSYSSGQNHIPICQNCDPQDVRKLLVEIKNVTFEDFNDKMSTSNYKFYQFRRVSIQIRSHKHLKYNLES